MPRIAHAQARYTVVTLVCLLTFCCSVVRHRESCVDQAQDHTQEVLSQTLLIPQELTVQMASKIVIRWRINFFSRTLFS